MKGICVEINKSETIEMCIDADNRICLDVYHDYGDGSNISTQFENNEDVQKVIDGLTKLLKERK